MSNETDTKLAVMSEKMKNIENDISEIKLGINELIKKMDEKFVTKNEFTPIKQIVYGFVGLIVVAVIGALISLVVK